MTDRYLAILVQTLVEAWQNRLEREIEILKKRFPETMQDYEVWGGLAGLVDELAVAAHNFDRVHHDQP